MSVKYPLASFPSTPSACPSQMSCIVTSFLWILIGTFSFFKGNCTPSKQRPLPFRTRSSSICYSRLGRPQFHRNCCRELFPRFERFPYSFLRAAVVTSAHWTWILIKVVGSHTSRLLYASHCTLWEEGISFCKTTAHSKIRNETVVSQSKREKKKDAVRNIKYLKIQLLHSYVTLLKTMLKLKS